MTPNQVTLIGAILCVATFFFWMKGMYWPGVVTASMVQPSPLTISPSRNVTSGRKSWSPLESSGLCSPI